MSTNENQPAHIPVLLREVMESFAGILAAPGGDGRVLLLDGTLGAAGHSSQLLAASKEVTLIGIDRDSSALQIADKRLGEFAPRYQLFKGNYSEAEELTMKVRAERGAFNGILLDLGISSMQIDTPERGFSFKFDGPLDMRMDNSQSLTAEAVVNEYGEGDLRRVFLRGGVKPDFAKSLARTIIHKRPLRTTSDLVSVCERVFESLPGGKGNRSKNPATIPFQALRIEVNDEFGSIKTFLDSVPNILAENGVLSVISFHSSEDRLIAGQMREWSRKKILSQFNPDLSLPGLGKLLTPKAIVPGAEEQERNPRSRSAMLRVFKRGMEQ